MCMCMQKHFAHVLVCLCVCVYADKGRAALKSHNERDKWNALYLGVGEHRGERFKDSLLIKSDGCCHVWSCASMREKISCWLCKCQGTEKHYLCMCVRRSTVASIDGRRMADWVKQKSHDFNPVLTSVCHHFCLRSHYDLSGILNLSPNKQRWGVTGKTHQKHPRTQECHRLNNITLRGTVVKVRCLKILRNEKPAAVIWCVSVDVVLNELYQPRKTLSPAYLISVLLLLWLGSIHTASPCSYGDLFFASPVFLCFLSLYTFGFSAKAEDVKMKQFSVLWQLVFILPTASSPIAQLKSTLASGLIMGTSYLADPERSADGTKESYICPLSCQQLSCPFQMHENADSLLQTTSESLQLPPRKHQLWFLGRFHRPGRVVKSRAIEKRSVWKIKCTWIFPPRCPRIRL